MSLIFLPSTFVVSKKYGVLPYKVFIAPLTEPALSKSVIVRLDDGSSFIIWGILWLNLSKSSRFISIFAVFAIAIKWSIEFVEPPKAKSITIAFCMLSFVIICFGKICFWTSSTIFTPDSKAILLFFALVAAALAQPSRLRPIVSVKTARVFAVYNPWQDPIEGQQFSSILCNVSSSICPACNFPIASKEPLINVRCSPSQQPSFIGPPVTTIDGIFNLKAAIIAPGVILSQFVSNTKPSSWCAWATVSIQSAIKSREGSEYFIPSCPIEIPSQTAGSPKMKACPPPVWIPFSICLSKSRKPTCPGTKSENELAMPINGLFIEPLVTPVEYNNALCGAFDIPSLISSLLIYFPFLPNL